MPRFYVRPLNLLERFLEWFFVLIMYILQVLQGNCLESPQRTHRWNNHHLDPALGVFLQKEMMVHLAGDPHALVRQGPLDVRFHLPVFGGWRQYVVVKPVDSRGCWYVGWYNDKALGISRLPLSTPVRLLRGPDDVQFFGLDATGEQIPIKYVGSGVIGQGGPFCQLPLH